MVTLINRVAEYAREYVAEEQINYVDLVFLSAQLMEKCRKKKKEMSTAYMDFKNVYERVGNENFRRVLDECAVEEYLIMGAKSLYKGVRA